MTFHDVRTRITVSFGMTLALALTAALACGVKAPPRPPVKEPPPSAASTDGSR